jgi:hypothetical protein
MMLRDLLLPTFVIFPAVLRSTPTPHFEEITAECGLEDTSGGKISFGDYDGDGDPDLLVGASRLYRNDSTAEKILLVEVTSEVGITPGGDGAAWCDLDRDGKLDFVTNKGDVWLQRKKGGFELEERLAFAVPGGKASAIGLGDLDGDGWLDVISGGGEQKGKLLEQKLWRNESGKGWVEITGQSGFGASRYGRAVVWCDYDGDGDQDVYSGNYRLQPNELFRNEDGELARTDAGVTGKRDSRMFTHEVDGVQQAFGYQYGHTIAASWADFDGDGWFDLWSSNLTHKFVGEVSAEFAKKIGSKYDFRGYYCDDSNLFINQGPPDFGFRDERVERGIPLLPIGDRGTYRGDELWSNSACGDCDNDGWIDVWVNQVYGWLDYSSGRLFCNREGNFHEVHGSAGIDIWGGYGGAWADLDSDGRLDLVVSGTAEAKRGGGQLHVFANRSEEQDWIGFRLVEEECALVVGAIVIVEQESHVQIRQVETTMGSHTQENDSRLHFGLGDEELERAWVRWPDGLWQLLEVTTPGRYHEIARPTGRTPTPKRLVPSTATVGEEVLLSVKGGRGVSYHWDLSGSRGSEAITETATLRTTFESAGVRQVRVRVVGRKGLAREGIFTIEVKAD